MRVVIGEDSALVPRRPRAPARRRRPRDRRQGRRRAVARGRRSRGATRRRDRRHPHATRQHRRRRARRPDPAGRIPDARHPPALAAHRDASLGRARRSGGFGYLLKDRVLDVDDFLDCSDAGRERRLRPRPRGRQPPAQAARTRRAHSRTSRPASARCSRSWPKAAPTSASPSRLYLSERTDRDPRRQHPRQARLAPAAKHHRRVLAVVAYLREALQPSPLA